MTSLSFRWGVIRLASGGGSLGAVGQQTHTATTVRPLPAPDAPQPGDLESKVNDLLQGKNPFGSGPNPTIRAIDDSSYTGQARLNSLLAKAPASLGKFSEGYDAWLLSQAEDVRDIEFTRLLRAMKAEARARQASRKQTKQDDQIAADEKSMRKTQETQGRYRKGAGAKPIIKGLVGQDSATGLQMGAVENPWLVEVAKKLGIDLGGDVEQVAIRTGDYVYTGQVADTKGGPKFTRPEYVYVEDAKSMIMSMPPEKIKEYQKRLGLVEHGLADPILVGLWEDAIYLAQGYARSGQKVELQFIFDTLVNAKVEKMKSGGGGGGGGGGAANRSDEESAYNYYFAMMQILGDISGVGN